MGYRICSRENNHFTQMLKKISTYINIFHTSREQGRKGMNFKKIRLWLPYKYWHAH